MHVYCPGEVFRKTCHCLWLAINGWLNDLILLVVFVYMLVSMVEMLESGGSSVLSIGCALLAAQLWELMDQILSGESENEVEICVCFM